jgi:hypothetical protein
VCTSVPSIVLCAADRRRNIFCFITLSLFGIIKSSIRYQKKESINGRLIQQLSRSITIFFFFFG